MEIKKVYICVNMYNNEQFAVFDKQMAEGWAYQDRIYHYYYILEVKYEF